MDFLSYRETGHIGGPSGKGHIRALDIGGIRRYREISHVWPFDSTVQLLLDNNPRRYFFS